MNHPLHGRSSRSLPHRPLALAVASSLLLATTLPAMASESLDAWQHQRQLQAAWARPVADVASAAITVPMHAGRSASNHVPG
ncbi:hypothetical protein [Stenotrophomonas maltophilia]|uniref:hypothetical protein n=1 Tax=Stenotrophomonas maltophilia TaxID=40324 RepID=UPI0013DCEDBB|nr:hypothetical protein [Stenotrophomonas maltophilia]